LFDWLLVACVTASSYAIAIEISNLTEEATQCHKATPREWQFSDYSNKKELQSTSENDKKTIQYDILSFFKNF